MDKPLQRLRIRPTGEADLADLGRLWNDGEVMRWVGFPDGLGYDEEALRRWRPPPGTVVLGAPQNLAGRRPTR